MRAEDITPETVKATLRAIHYGKPLAASPLVDHSLVRLRLRDFGHADTVLNREWTLQQVLLELVSDKLALLRAERAVPAAGGDLAQLVADYRADSQTLEAWSLLYARYLAPVEPPEGRVLADQLGVIVKTLTRRLDRGHRLLADALRAAEIEAAAGLAARPGRSPAEGVVTDAAAPSLPLPDAAAALLAALRDDAQILPLPEATLSALAGAPPADLTAYRLSRVAAWTRPEFALDQRFVELTLLVDQGEAAVQGRWVAKDERYDDLGAALAAVAEPAAVVLGPPGAGKSTLLRRLELDTAIAGLRGEGDAVTFFVSLNQYASGLRGGPPPEPGRWLAERWAANYPQLPRLYELLAEGRLVLLLDALNEMPHASTERYWEQVRAWKRFLEEAVAGGRGNRAVFSCRSLDYSQPLSSPALRVPQLQVEPLSDTRVEAFLHAHNPRLAGAVWAELAGTAQLEVLRSPYYLDLLVRQVETTGKLPRGRAELFTGFVRQGLRREIEQDNALLAPDGLLTERDVRQVTQGRWKGAHDLPERGLLIPKLARLAYAMQRGHGGAEQSQVRVEFEDALAIIETDTGSMAELAMRRSSAHHRDMNDAHGAGRHSQAGKLGEAVVAAGTALSVLDQDAATDEVMYVHQLVQEYFAARELARMPDPEVLRREWRAAWIAPTVRELVETLPAGETLPPLPQTGWEETVVLAAAMAGDAADFLRGMMDANLALAGRAAGQAEVRERLGVGAKDVSPFPPAFLNELRWALVRRSRDPAADLRDRIACGMAAGELGDPRFERRVGSHGAYLAPPMVDIPGGLYPIGEDDPIAWTTVGETGTDTAHIPRHAVEIAPFQIGRFPVTNAEWRCFMAAGGYEDERWWDTEDGRAWRRGELADEGAKQNNRNWRKRFLEHPELFEQMVREGNFPSEAAVRRWREWLALADADFEAALDRRWLGKPKTGPEFWQDERTSGAPQPVVGICWYEARAYCNWLGAQSGRSFRLPTEVEWEAAARGSGGRLYAYGDAFDATKGNTIETHMRRAAPVGVLVEGDTPEGLSDMGGNVEEWTSSAWGGEDALIPRFGYPYDPGDGREDAHAGPACPRVLRGGAWDNDRSGARAAHRGRRHPNGRYASVGFRCCSSVEQ